MNAIILSIGDELALGQTVDTNSAWMSQQLSAIGLRVVAHSTVADDLDAIAEAIRLTGSRSEVLLISGGLGPTDDDLTRQALATALGVPLDLHEAAMSGLIAWFSKLGRTMAESNKIQAYIPRGASMIENTAGTAPGIEAVFDKARGSAAAEKEPSTTSPICRIFVMPGVPKEMKTMFARDVLPKLQALGGGAAIISRTLHTFGLGESNVGERLGELMKRGRNPSVGTTVSGGIVSLRINAQFESKERAVLEANVTVAACHEKLGDLIYGEGEQTLAKVVADQLFALKYHTLTTAESCTGGLLAKMLTDIPGSSCYFERGWLTYSDQSKQELLDVPADLLRENGAVSEAVVQVMAINARAKAVAHYGLAISGIAGPGGGTPEKPVGTVCIALAAGSAMNKGGALPPTTIQVRSFRFPGDREFIRDRSAKMALAMLRFHLLGKELPF